MRKDTKANLKKVLPVLSQLCDMPNRHLRGEMVPPGECWINYGWLGRKTELSKWQVLRTIRNIKSQQLISVESKPGVGGFVRIKRIKPLVIERKTKKQTATIKPHLSICTLSTSKELKKKRLQQQATPGCCAGSLVYLRKTENVVRISQPPAVTNPILNWAMSLNLKQWAQPKFVVELESIRGHIETKDPVLTQDDKMQILMNCYMNLSDPSKTKHPGSTYMKSIVRAKTNSWLTQDSEVIGRGDNKHKYCVPHLKQGSCGQPDCPYSRFASLSLEEQAIASEHGRLMRERSVKF